MAYIPPHKRHSKVLEKLSPTPEFFVPRFEREANLKPVKSNVARRGMTLYANNAISRWFMVGSTQADEFPASVHLDLVSLEKLQIDDLPTEKIEDTIIDLRWLSWQVEAVAEDRLQMTDEQMDLIIKSCEEIIRLKDALIRSLEFHLALDEECGEVYLTDDFINQYGNRNRENIDKLMRNIILLHLLVLTKNNEAEQSSFYISEIEKIRLRTEELLAAEVEDMLHWMEEEQEQFIQIKEHEEKQHIKIEGIETALRRLDWCRHQLEVLTLNAGIKLKENIRVHTKDEEDKETNQRDGVKPTGQLAENSI